MDRLVNGATLGPFRIIHQIGEGGMAKVYKAYQPSMERYVALKILPAHYAEDPQFIERFNREARVIARLEHQNILPVFDYGEQGGITYLAMRYVEGGTLKELLKQGKLTLHDTLQIITQVCAALDYAHRQGVIHRDVKPSNIILDKEGAAYLTDFGIAKVLGAGSDLTGTGAAIGTPAYMAPEQALGEKVDGRTDIYALGVVLYEMVVGQVPFQADTPMAILMAHLREPLPLPHERNPKISEAVEAVIIKAMAKEPTDRYQTANELAQALRLAVYASTPEEVETTLLHLIKDVQAQRRGFTTIAEPDLESDPRLLEKLEQHYIDGLSAYWTRDWGKARAFFQAIITLHPAYKDAAARLQEVEKQLRLAQLYEQASTAMQNADYHQAQGLLRQVITLDAGYQEAAQLLRQADLKVELMALYAQAEQLHQGEQWQAVIKIFERIHALDAAYPDPKGLLASARSGLAEQQRLEKVKAIYQRGLLAMDEGRWKDAQKLFEQVKAQQPGYAETDQLLKRAIDELAQERLKKRQRQLEKKPPAQPTALPESQETLRATPVRKRQRVGVWVAISLALVIMTAAIIVSLNWASVMALLKPVPPMPTVLPQATSIAKKTEQPALISPTKTVKPAEPTSRPGPQLLANFDDPDLQVSLNQVLNQKCGSFSRQGQFFLDNELHLDNLPSSQDLLCQIFDSGYEFAENIKPIQARLKYGLQAANGLSTLWLVLLSEEFESKNIQAVCGLKTDKDNMVYKTFSVWEAKNSISTSLYDQAIPGRYNAWYTMRLDLDPETMTFYCFFDDWLIGKYQPKNASFLRTVKFNQFVESGRSPLVTAHTIIDDIFYMPRQDLATAGKAPITSESVTFRLRLTTSSDWTTMRLLSRGNFRNTKVLNSSGKINQAENEEFSLNMVQELDRAFAGHSISQLYELSLEHPAEEQELRIKLEKGCVGETEIDIYNTATGFPFPVFHTQVDSCEKAETFHITLETLLSLSPPAIPESIPIPSMPDQLDQEGSSIITVCPSAQPPRQMCIRNVKTGKLKEIGAVSNFWEYYNFSWAPDGKTIVLAAKQQENQPLQIFTIKADGSKLAKLTSSTQDFTDAIWSPDGNWIAAARFCRSVWLFRPDSEEKRQILSLPEDLCVHWLRWSPDGKYLAMVNTYNFPAPPSIWVVNQDGQELHRIFKFPADIFRTGFYFKELAWSPDGKQVGAFFGTDQMTQGVLITLDGSQEPQPVDWAAPTWWLPSFYPQWGNK